MIFLLLIALIVLGPEKLPDAIRKFGRAYAEFRKMANGFQGELKQAFDEPLRELKGTADALRGAANFDLEGKAQADSASTSRPAEADLPSRPTPAVSEVPSGTLNFGATNRNGLNFAVPIESAPAVDAAEAIVPTDGDVE